MSYILLEPAEVATAVATGVRLRRLGRGWTQAELAERAGVALSTLKLFERRGKISLDRLLRIAAALGDLDSFLKLFAPPPARSLAEIEARHSPAANTERRRGRRRKKRGAT